MRDYCTNYDYILYNCSFYGFMFWWSNKLLALWIQLLKLIKLFVIKNLLKIVHVSRAYTNTCSLQFNTELIEFQAMFKNFQANWQVGSSLVRWTKEKVRPRSEYYGVNTLIKDQICYQP